MANSWASDQTIYVGEKTVAAAGTAEALDTIDTVFRSILIIPKTGNTNQVYLGGSDVASTTNDGLDADESVTFSTDIPRHRGFRLSDIYADVDTNGEGVDFYCIV